MSKKPVETRKIASQMNPEDAYILGMQMTEICEGCGKEAEKLYMVGPLLCEDCTKKEIKRINNRVKGLLEKARVQN